MTGIITTLVAWLVAILLAAAATGDAAPVSNAPQDTLAPTPTSPMPSAMPLPVQDSQLHSATSQVTIQRPAAVDVTPEPVICTIDEVVVDCLANGIDPLWTADPDATVGPCPTSDPVTGAPPDTAWLGCPSPTDQPTEVPTP